MSRARVAVLRVISRELSATDAAAQYGYSRQHLHRLIARYKAGGLDAVEPRSRRPKSNPQATGDKVRDFIIATRLELTAAGWDAGSVTIAWHLERAGLRVPPASTIRRILHAAALVTPEPKKRPRSSCLRFAAARPNECWQSDFTHWPLAGGTDAEVINWLDGHSRYLLAASARAPVTGQVVVGTFLQASNANGLPASTLTDNGRVYTARFGGGRNAFEYLLAALGITQKNGHPFHPQTQGKAGRFHQIQKRWPGSRPPPPWPGSRPGSTPSASTTTSTAPAGPSSAPLPARPTGPCPRPAPQPLRTAATGCAMTMSTPAARSASATPAACTTSASAAPTAAGKSSPSSTRPASPSSSCGPARSCLPTTLTPATPTGATNSEARADGPGQLSPKTRLRCLLCRDSRHGALGGTRTPDLLHAMQHRFV
jgi:transposase